MEKKIQEKYNLNLTEEKTMNNITTDFITMMELLTDHFASFACKGTWSDVDRAEWQTYQKFVSQAQTHLRSIKPPRDVKQERGYESRLEATAEKLEQQEREREAKFTKDFSKFSLKKSELGNVAEWFDKANKKMDSSRYGSLLDRYMK